MMEESDAWPDLALLELEVDVRRHVGLLVGFLICSDMTYTGQILSANVDKWVA